MNRTIVMVLKDEFQSAVADLIRKEWTAAIGYLCSWAIHNPKYAHLTICGDSEGNVNATYRQVDGGDVTYSMAAMLREDGTYGFHS